MKKLIPILILSLGVLNVVAHVDLNTPTGGETYKVCETVTIEWQIAISHTLLNWDLFYSDDGGSTWDTIQIDIPPTGSSVGTIVTYDWVVPDIAGDSVKIWIYMDNAATDYQDKSGNFTVLANVNIPDSIFKAQLVADLLINTNADSIIQYIEACAYTGAINVASLGITDLTGIEAFTGIVGLDCSENDLTSLDVTQNIALAVLLCDNNQLTSLDVSNNTTLTNLICDSNQISALDLSNNSALQELECENNLLTALSVSSNTMLTHLHCYDNQITSLDVSSNSALIMLLCDNNQIPILNVSMSSAMIMLECAGNQLT